MSAHWRNTIERKLQLQNDLQTWSGHVDIRMDELSQILELPAVRAHYNGNVLEFGCGNALAAVYFSKYFNQINATDLQQVDHKNHAIGLTKAEKMIQLFGVQNVKLAAGSGEELDFPNSSQDIVFSHFVLEHIPDKNKCLSECLRVLKPGGHAVMAVPAFCSTLLYPVSFYSDFVKRVWSRIYKLKSTTQNAENKINLPNSELEPPVVKDLSSFRKAYPHFPMPEPHGAYSSYFDELFNQRITAWENLFLSAGFTEVKVSALCVLPRSLMTALLGNTGLKIYMFLEPLDRWLCKLSFFKPFAQYICISAKKMN